MKKSIIIILFNMLFISGCSNYFSDYKTVYRITTTNNTYYYSEKQPKLANDEYYIIKDLDDNKHRIKKDALYKIEKYKHRK